MPQCHDETYEEYESRIRGEAAELADSNRIKDARFQAHAEAVKFPISLRDFFAGCALTGIAAGRYITGKPATEIAKYAHELGDAMLAAKKEKEDQQP